MGGNGPCEALAEELSLFFLRVNKTYIGDTDLYMNKYIRTRVSSKMLMGLIYKIDSLMRCDEIGLLVY